MGQKRVTKSVIESEPNARPCPVVVIAASAGGYQALKELLASLPANFNAAIAVALHRGTSSPSYLIDLLSKQTPLLVKEAVDGDRLTRGTIHICPAGMHMTAHRTLSLIDAPRLNYVKPSA